MITALQDETHRFAITYHQLLRSKGQVHSILDDIKGIGQKRRRALMLHFQTIEAVRNASVEELLSLPEMNQASAESVYRFFHEPAPDAELTDDSDMPEENIEDSGMPEEKNDD